MLVSPSRATLPGGGSYGVSLQNLRQSHFPICLSTAPSGVDLLKAALDDLISARLSSPFGRLLRGLHGRVSVRVGFRIVANQDGESIVGISRFLMRISGCTPPMTDTAGKQSTARTRQVWYDAIHGGKTASQRPSFKPLLSESPPATGGPETNAPSRPAQSAGRAAIQVAQFLNVPCWIGSESRTSSHGKTRARCASLP